MINGGRLLDAWALAIHPDLYIHQVLFMEYWVRRGLKNMVWRTPNIP